MPMRMGAGDATDTKHVNVHVRLTHTHSVDNLE